MTPWIFTTDALQTLRQRLQWDVEQDTAQLEHLQTAVEEAELALRLRLHDLRLMNDDLNERQRILDGLPSDGRLNLVARQLEELIDQGRKATHYTSAEAAVEDAQRDLLRVQGVQRLVQLSREERLAALEAIDEGMNRERAAILAARSTESST